MNKNDFFFPRSRYYGQVTLENLVFNANLQEFSQRVGIICSLETAGKISTIEAFQQIEVLWEQLQRSGERLSIDTLAVED